MNENDSASGIVYLLTNDAMPGLVKIGRTSRSDVEARMNELFSTEVPVPFSCEFACEVANAKDVEKALHTAFYPQRIHPRREFFKIDPDQAVAILQLLGSNVRDITGEIEKEIDNEISTEDRAAQKRLVRPPFKFLEMDIPEGSLLVYTENSEISVTTCKNNKVLYNEHPRSLTSVTTELLERNRNVQPTPYWLYNGEKLIDIYNRFY